MKPLAASSTFRRSRSGLTSSEAQIEVGRAGRSLVVVALLAYASVQPAWAAPDDMRVLTDQLADPHDFDVEIQTLSVQARRSSLAPRQSIVQGLAELSYGVIEGLEVSVQMPISREGGTWRANGINLEAQYIAPHDSDAGFYWGVRTEFARSRAPLEAARSTSVEIRPIVGYRIEDWHAVFNGAIHTLLAGVNHHTSWEPSAKVTRQLERGMALGVEYYVQAAEQGEGATGLGRRKLALLVWDTKIRALELSVGVGRGIGRSGDGTVIKFIGAFEL